MSSFSIILVNVKSSVVKGLIDVYVITYVITFIMSGAGMKRKRRDSLHVLSKKGSSYSLDVQEMPLELKKEMKELERFYRADLNPKRDGVPFSESTMEKTRERCRCFLYYVRAVHPDRELSLTLCNDTDLVYEYVCFLREKRKLKPSTLSRMISVMLSVVKFNYRQEAISHDKLKEVIFLRRLQSQLERENRILSKKEKEGLSGQKRAFYHAHILQAAKSLRCKFEESSGRESVRFLHDFLIVSLFITIMPGRSKELRTLLVHVEATQGSLDTASVDCGNYMNFRLDGSISVTQTDFKTSKSTGPVRLTITPDDMLAYYLKLLLRKRARLLLGNSHNYFFVSYKGEPFVSTGSFSNYIGGIFEREVHIRVGTTALRHAILTYFNSLEESNDQRLRESLATLMKHTVRYQKTVYDDRSHEERTQLGRQFLREKISDGIFQESDAEVSDSSEDDEYTVKVAARVNDICCLLDPCSTHENVHIHLAKVVRFTADHSEVYLAHMEELPDSNNLYVLRAGKVWKESCSSLIYPVDVVYNPSENAYELRTSKRDIFDAVKK